MKRVNVMKAILVNGIRNVMQPVSIMMGEVGGIGCRYDRETSARINEFQEPSSG